MPEDPRLTQFFKMMYLERALLLSAAGMLFGLTLLSMAVLEWRAVGYGHLDYASTMRLVIPGATLTALSFQTVLSSFFVSILGMRRR